MKQKYLKDLVFGDIVIFNQKCLGPQVIHNFNTRKWRGWMKMEKLQIASCI
jgi:hypothetical protein